MSRTPIQRRPPGVPPEGMPSRGEEILESGRNAPPAVRPGGSGIRPITLIAVIAIALVAAYAFRQGGSRVEPQVERAEAPAPAVNSGAMPAPPDTSVVQDEPESAVAGRPMIPCSMLGSWHVRFGNRDLGVITLDSAGRFEFQGSSGGWSVISYKGGHAVAWDYGPSSPRPNEINPIHAGRHADEFTLTETDGNTTTWNRVNQAVAQDCDAWEYSTAS